MPQKMKIATNAAPPSIGTHSQAIRVGDLKAIRHDRDAPVEVYHLKLDPGEKRNIADQSREFVSRAEELFRTARSPSEEWPMKTGSEATATGKEGKKKKA